MVSRRSFSRTDALGPEGRTGVRTNTLEQDKVVLQWDGRVLAAHTTPHFMQSSTWARIRSAGPWRVTAAELGAGTELPAFVYERTAPGTGVLRHVPRLSGVAPADVAALTMRAIADPGEAFATKIEFAQPKDEALDDAFISCGWLPTRASQYRYAVIVDLSDGVEAAFDGMKKRGRAEIRTGERNGIEVERVRIGGPGTDDMLALVRATEQRSGAFFRSDAYLRSVWDGFAADDRGHLYLARHEGRVVSGAFVARFGSRAWYKDGGSLRDVPNLMASRLLQWRIMQDLAADGVTHYDLGHVPPPDAEHPAGRGILTFKTAFAPVTEFQPAYLLPHTAAGERWRVTESQFLAAHRADTGDYWY
jgi:lipid II:glycine glycyltransferase (peptidoglycan interpeptide bridge formation enzyme)